jgi:hypothetical protein
LSDVVAVSRVVGVLDKEAKPESESEAESESESKEGERVAGLAGTVGAMAGRMVGWMLLCIMTICTPSEIVSVSVRRAKAGRGGGKRKSRAIV